MKQCPRCSHWHHSVVSDVCDRCWEDLGQMTFEDFGMIDEEEVEDEAVIDTFFDREEEARGYQ